jgi:hypothetical protein
MKNTNPSSPKRFRRLPTRGKNTASDNEVRFALVEEIERLTALAARVDEMFDEDRSLADLLRALDGLGKNATRIIALLKAQKELGGENDSMSTLHQALAAMIADMKKQHPS